MIRETNQGMLALPGVAGHVLKHAQRWVWLALLLAGMLLPIWVGPYPALYDYPNHLLEAQVAAQYHDPAFGYQEGYQLNPDWYLRSNALTTLLLMGLNAVMPIRLAGQIVLSIYMVLMLSGLALLLRPAGSGSPLLILAPLLAYNMGFTSGWLNFSYGAALGLHALAVFLRRQKQDRLRDLGLLALLALLIYIAHALALVLLLAMLAAMAAVTPLQLRRHGALLLALNAPLPLLLATRPALGLAIAAMGPLILVAGAMLRRLRLRPILLVAGVPAAALLEVLLLKVLKPYYQPMFPEVRYNLPEKPFYLLRLFTTPHQFMPPDGLLVGANGVLLALLFVLGGLLVWSTLRQADTQRGRWFAGIAVLMLAYVALPNRTNEIWIIEPRVLIFAAFVALAGVRLPAMQSRLYRVVIICVLALGLVSTGANIRSALLYTQQARHWQAQLDTLAPARSVLMLRGINTRYIQPGPLRAFNTFFSGEQFSTVYALNHGGFVSRIFDSGPVRPQPAIPIPFYYWSGFESADYVSQHCADLRASYDAVLVWETPEPDLAKQLDHCFGTQQQLQDMSIWKRAGR